MHLVWETLLKGSIIFFWGFWPTVPTKAISDFLVDSAHFYLLQLEVIALWGLSLTQQEQLYPPLLIRGRQVQQIKWCPFYATVCSTESKQSWTNAAVAAFENALKETINKPPHHQGTIASDLPAWRTPSITSQHLRSGSYLDRALHRHTRTSKDAHWKEKRGLEAWSPFSFRIAADKIGVPLKSRRWQQLRERRLTKQRWIQTHR